MNGSLVLDNTLILLQGTTGAIFTSYEVLTNDSREITNTSTFLDKPWCSSLKKFTWVHYGRLKHKQMKTMSTYSFPLTEFYLQITIKIYLHKRGRSVLNLKIAYL